MRTRPFLILAAAVLALGACSTPNGELDGNRVHPKSWADPASYQTPDFHGTMVVEKGNDSCRTCHGSDLTGSGDIPSCTACHSSIGGGHDTGWSSPSEHGAAAVADFALCTQCHGADYQGGITQVACSTSCHRNLDWPHGADWLDTSSTGFHGASAVDCARCHGADHRGGSTGVGCFTCHFDENGSRVPAGSGWTHGTTHGDLEAYEAVCNQCHGLKRQYEDIPSTCHDCHGDGGGHAPGWSAPEQHGAEAERDFSACASCHGDDYQGGTAGRSCYECHDGPGLNHPLEGWLDNAASNFHGSDTADCASCHGADFSGGAAGIDCDTCHFGPGGAREPAGAGWTHPAGPHDALETYGDVCNACHDIERGFGRGPDPTCHDCHGSGGGHTTGQPWLDRNGAEFHGTSTLDCTLCHGSDYQGGITGVGCDSCHFGPSGSKVPTGSGWTHGPTSHNTLGGDEAVCNACHDLVRTYGYGPAECHNCHDNEPAPHVVDGSTYLAATAHGSDAKADLYPCGSCHGEDDGGGNVRFDRGIQATGGFGCESCHGNWGAHPVSGGGWHNRAPDIRHDSAGRQDVVCALCHGSDLGGSATTGAPACTSCHKLGSPLGTAGTCVSCHGNPPLTNGAAPNRDGRHKKHYEEGITDCAICHGSGGPGSTTHFHDPAQAAAVDDAGTNGMTFNQTSGQVTCSSTCHAAGKNEDHGGGKNWY